MQGFPSTINHNAIIVSAGSSENNVPQVNGVGRGGEVTI